MDHHLLTREQREEKEKEFLAPYAMKGFETGGREYKEKEHPYRSVYQRDKDRIVYSTAFRRLEYKTQVFVNHEGDYYRTRLTHTLEVAQISRTIARALKLNEDLVEAIALAHDLGHTPFGHAGEDALSELMKDHGGFDHNCHGLRVVDVLEKKYPEFPGLNLTREVRRGIICHSTPYDNSRASAIDVPGTWLLETQVVDAADEIAYDNHDLDDGLKSGLLSGEELSCISIWNDAKKRVNEKYSDLDRETEKAQIVRDLINVQVSDLINNSILQISSKKIKSISDLEKQREKTVDFSIPMNKQRQDLKDFLKQNLYSNYRVVCMTNKATRFLRKLFEVYIENPGQLPPQAAEKIDERGKYRVVCDYMAGMTDRYALDQYKKFFEPYERV